MRNNLAIERKGEDQDEADCEGKQETKKQKKETSRKESEKAPSHEWLQRKDLPMEEMLKDLPCLKNLRYSQVTTSGGADN